MTPGHPLFEAVREDALERARDDLQRGSVFYDLYVVFNCGSKPEAHVVQDPARLGWEPLMKIEHYHVDARAILAAATMGE